MSQVHPSNHKPMPTPNERVLKAATPDTATKDEHQDKFDCSGCPDDQEQHHDLCQSPITTIVSFPNPRATVPCNFVARFRT